MGGFGNKKRVWNRAVPISGCVSFQDDDRHVDRSDNCCLKKSAWILHVWNSHLHLP